LHSEGVSRYCQRLNSFAVEQVEQVFLALDRVERNIKVLETRKISFRVEQLWMESGKLVP